MNKKEFFDELNEYLIGVKKEDKEEILQDYEEHFKIGKRKKRSEQDIIKSLGEPKQIAREIRRELSHSDKEELKSEAIETWVAAKKLSIHLFNETKDKIESIPKTQKGKKRIKNYSTLIVFILLLSAVMLIFNSSFVLIVTLLFLGYLAFQTRTKSATTRSKTKKHDKTPRQNTKGTNLFRVMLVIAFNVFFFIGVWIALLSTLIGLFIVSLAILTSSILVIIFMVFALISYNTPVTKDIMFSGLFGGLGLAILGGLLINLSIWLIKLFFKMTKHYVEWNTRFVKK